MSTKPGELQTDAVILPILFVPVGLFVFIGQNKGWPGGILSMQLEGDGAHPVALTNVLASIEYVVVYDAASSRFPAWPVALMGLVVAVAGVGLGTYFRRRNITSAFARMVVTSAIIFGVSWTVLVGGGLYAQHGQLVSALREGSVVRVEGIVYDRPTGPADQPTGSWVVEEGAKAYWYRYDRSPLSVGYRRSAPGTGGLRDGVRVRIADVAGRIARVEVER